MIQKTNCLIVIIFFFILSICCFNYYVDPYDFFNKKILQINKKPVELVFPIIRRYKDFKYETVIIGSSPATTLFNQEFLSQLKISCLFLPRSNYNFFYKILKVYLQYHPETKEVLIPLNFEIIFNQNIIKQENNSNKHLENISMLLFSIDATKRSYKKIKFKQGQFQDKYEEVYPYITDSFSKRYSNKIIQNDNYKYIDLIVELLNSKNIKYKFYISPIHANLLAYINKDEYLKNLVKNTKKHVCKHINASIYDMAFANKYTTISMFDTQYAIFRDYTHPNGNFWFKKTFEVLFDTKNSDKDLFFVINADNVEEIIKKENKLIENYIKNNKEEVNNYYEIVTLGDKDESIENILIKKYHDKLNYDVNEEKEYRQEILKSKGIF